MSIRGSEGAGGAEPARSEKMGGLEKGLAIIEMFGSGYDQLTVADAARGSDTTRASARRCLLTLADLGYVEFDGKFYRPRPRLRRLGGRSVDTGALSDYARPVLEKICEQLAESVSLAVLDGRSSLFIARAEASRVVSTGVRVGAILPAYCSATGRILLSALEDDEIRQYLADTDLVARTARTMTDPDRIFDAIVVTREKGFAVSDEELELGMRSIAVPVRDRSGEVIAAMSLSTSSARVSVKTMLKDHLGPLRTAASALEKILKRG